jgi:hypothetical protein
MGCDPLWPLSGQGGKAGHVLWPLKKACLASIRQEVSNPGATRDIVGYSLTATPRAARYSLHSRMVYSR